MSIYPIIRLMSPGPVRLNHAEGPSSNRPGSNVLRTRKRSGASDSNLGVHCTDVVFQRGCTTADDGFGYGLAIVDQIAEAHGWTVVAEDPARGGARFEIVTGARRSGGGDRHPAPE